MVTRLCLLVVFSVVACSDQTPPGEVEILSAVFSDARSNIVEGRTLVLSPRVHTRNYGGHRPLEVPDSILSEAVLRALAERGVPIDSSQALPDTSVAVLTFTPVARTSSGRYELFADILEIDPPEYGSGYSNEWRYTVECEADRCTVVGKSHTTHSDFEIVGSGKK